MLRPIDTQTIYQQTPEVSKNQQATRHNEEMQQVQTAHTIQKEARDKEKVVIETQEHPKADNDVKRRKGGGGGAAGGRNKKKKPQKPTTKKTATPTTQDDGHFDFKI